MIPTGRGCQTSRELFRERNAAGAVEALRPIAFIKVGYGDVTGRTAAGVYETIIAEIDADMRKGAAQGIEKYQVSRLQFGFGDLRADPADGERVMRQAEPRDLMKYMADEAAAIEAFIGIASAIAILSAV